MSVAIEGMKMPASCSECRLARLVPFHDYRKGHRPKALYKCFLTKQVGTDREGHKSRLSECPLREKKEK